MWRIQKKEKFDIWENDLCSLKVQYEENKYVVKEAEIKQLERAYYRICVLQ